MTELRKAILATRGRLFGVTFVKSDGSRRDMVCRLGVRSYLRGGDPAYDAEAKGNVFVYDVNVARDLPADERHKAYRSFKLSRVVRFRADGYEFQR